MTIETDFWRRKKPAEFTDEEWEAVCARCGQCCRIKLEDEDNGNIYYTDVVCRYFNRQTGCCSCYAERCQKVPSCLKLNAYNISELAWIPSGCAYRRLAETGTLPDWHPLVSKQPLPAEFSAAGKVVSEDEVPPEELEEHILEDWTDE